MNLNLGPAEDLQDSANTRSAELGQLLRSTIEDFRLEHPEVSTKDVEEALRSAAEEEVRDDSGAPVPIFFPDERESFRVRAATGVLVVLFVIAMAAALFLIRRP